MNFLKIHFLRCINAVGCVKNDTHLGAYTKCRQFSQCLITIWSLRLLVLIGILLTQLFHWFGLSFRLLVILMRCGSPYVLPLHYNGYSSCEGKFHSEFVDSDFVLVWFWLDVLFSPFCLHQWCWGQYLLLWLKSLEQCRQSSLSTLFYPGSRSYP